MVHIVQIHESFGSGTLAIVADIVRKTHELNWKTTIFHGMRAETPDNFRELFPAGTIFKRLATGRRINFLTDAVDSVRIASYARTTGATLLHGHSSKGGALARLAGTLVRKPALYTPHGFPFLNERGADTRKLAYGIEKLLGRLPGTIICCSPSEAAVARLLSRHVGMVANFVDTTHIDARVDAMDAPSCDVIAAGRITAQKNPRLFMDVASRMPHRKFVWVGGPVAKINDAPPNVTITGWVSRDDVLAHLARAKVYLSTSLYEGMPIAVLEAQALRRAVVATDIPGTSDIVENGNTGLIANTAEDIEAALERLLSDAELRASLGANARAIVEDRHSAKINLAQWAAYYRDLAGEPRPEKASQTGRNRSYVG